jgi:hypothetical protein
VAGRTEEKRQEDIDRRNCITGNENGDRRKWRKSNEELTGRT